MSDETYNGWTNYATWGIPLVLDNEPSTYEIRLTLVRETRGGEYRTAIVADRLKYLTERLIYGDDELAVEAEMSAMARQVISAGLAEVDWDEIARHYIEEDNERED